MATPKSHARFSPSSAHRHLNCTASLQFESNFEGYTSKYAQEGTLAHEFCELYGRKAFNRITDEKFTLAIGQFAQDNDGLFDKEMLDTASKYAEYLLKKANEFEDMPYVDFEVRVDMSHMIPECFGTCDCVMVGGDTLHITDYKHGKGVRVSPVENAQMRLYAIGALKLYQAIFGDTIKRVSTAIVQPRITDEVLEDAMSVDDLLAWGKKAGETAKICLGPRENQTFNPGDWCKFCKASTVCRAYGRYCIAAERVMDKPFPAAGEPTDADVRAVCGLPDALSDAEIADMLTRYDALKGWYDAAESYAVSRILSGGVFPGFRVVEGKSNRAWSDDKAVVDALTAEGYAKEDFHETKIFTPAKVEKLLKSRFSDVCGPLVVKPAGKPTLVRADDKRPDYNPGLADFAGVMPNGNG